LTSWAAADTGSINTLSSASSVTRNA